jgi:uncharacterized protein GlcG (DUF336 family)
LTVFATVAGAAQQPITYQDKPVGPQSLPGDNLPPFMMLDSNGKLIPDPPPPPGGLHRPGVGKPESDAIGPDLSLSIAGAQAAIAECKRLGARGAATVVDSAGDARAMLTADGADGSHVFVAQRKAITALEFEMPSAKVKELAKSGDRAILSRIKPNMFVQFGAYPLTAHGKIIGAIGYSGGIDEPCAKAGWEYMQKSLPQ